MINPSSTRRDLTQHHVLSTLVVEVNSYAPALRSTNIGTTSPSHGGVRDHRDAQCAPERD